MAEGKSEKETGGKKKEAGRQMKVSVVYGEKKLTDCMRAVIRLHRCQ